MDKDDNVFIGQILEYAHKIVERTQGLTRKEFDHNDILRDGLAFRVQCIGEAASRLSQSYRVQHPEVPWQRIVSIRHRIVHDYMNINPNILWEVVTKSVPELIQLLQSPDK